MKTVLIICLSILLGSCDTNYSYMPINDKSFRINISRGSINHATPTDWRVGRRGKYKTLSKGFKISLKLPVISPSDLKDIHSKIKADSWVLKISRRGSEGRAKVLGNIRLPLTKGRVKSSSKNIHFKRLRRAVFSIYYSAAAHSKRFERFPCPAFGHNKLISKARVIDSSNTRPLKLKIHYRERAGVSGGLETIDFTTRVNAGMSMTGNYIFELAFYNSVYKNRIGPFMPFKEQVVVPQEDQVDVRSCAGFRPKGLPTDSQYREFKFGR